MDNDCRLKIMHIASGDLWAGAEVQLYTLATTLHTKLGADVHVVLLNHGKLEQRLRAVGIDVTVVDETQLNGFQILRRLVQTIRTVQPQIVHTHRLKENILGSIAAWICGNIPSLRTAHGAPEHNPSWRHPYKRIYVFLDWLCGRYLQHRVIAVSEDLAEFLRGTFPSQKICVIENGIDIEAVQRNDKPTHIAVDASPNSVKIGVVGRLVPVKRIDLAIQTARYILDHHPDLNTSFHIFGDGPQREQLEQLSRDLGTDRIVHFEGHSNHIYEELQKLDVLLLTSDHEGLPMILLEAMALEIPIISHAVGGIPHLLAQGSCGVLVHDHSSLGYAHAICQFVKKPEDRKKITNDALTRVINFYSAEKKALMYIQQYAYLNQSKIPNRIHTDKDT